MTEKVIDTEKVLAWRMDGKLYGIDICKCKSIEKNKKIVEVPHAPEEIAGIVNLRGDIVTVVNLSNILGYSESVHFNENVIIRLRTDKNNLSIKADLIHDVVDISTESINSLPANLSDIEMRFFESIATIGNEIIILLNTNEIINTIELLSV